MTMSQSLTIANCDDVAVAVTVDIEVDALPAPCLQPSLLLPNCMCIFFSAASPPLALADVVG